MEIGLTAKVSPEVDDRATEEAAGKLEERMQSSVEGLETDVDMDNVVEQIDDLLDRAEAYHETTDAVSDRVNTMNERMQGGGFERLETIATDGFAGDMLFEPGVTPMAGEPSIGPTSGSAEDTPSDTGMGNNIVESVSQPLRDRFEDSAVGPGGTPGLLPGPEDVGLSPSGGPDRQTALRGAQEVAQLQSITGALNRLGNVFLDKGGKVVLAGLGLIFLSRLLDSASRASPLLGQVIDLFSLAIQLFFRPFGNFLGSLLLPLAGALLQLAADFNRIASSEGLAVAIGVITVRILRGTLNALASNIENVLRFAAIVDLFGSLIKRAFAGLRGAFSRQVIAKIPGPLLSALKTLSGFGALQGIVQELGRLASFVKRELARGLQAIGGILRRVLPNAVGKIFGKVLSSLGLRSIAVGISRIAGYFVPLLNVLLLIDLLLDVLLGWSPVFDTILPGIFDVLTGFVPLLSAKLDALVTMVALPFSLLTSFLKLLFAVTIALSAWVIENVGAFVETAIDWLEGAGQILADGVDFVEDILGGTVDFVDDILGGAVSLGENLVDDSVDVATDTANSAASAGSGFLSGSIDFVQDVFGGTVDIVGDLFNGTVNIVQDLFGGTVNIIQDLFGGTVNIIQELFNGAVSILTDLFNGAVNIVQDVFQGTFDVGSQLFSGGVNIAQNFFEGGVNIARDFFEGGVNIAQDMFTAVVDIADQLFTGTVNVVEDIFGGAYVTTRLFIMDLFGGAYNRVSQLVKSLFGGVFNSVSGFIDKLFGGVVDIVSQVFDGGFSSLSAFVTDLFGSTFDSATDFIGSVIPDTPGPQDIIEYVFPSNIGGDDGLLSFLPGGEEGGVVTSPTTAVIGEGGEPEYVVPESKLGGFVSNVMGGESGEGAVPGRTAFAEGGVVTGPTQAMVGEGGESEAIVPFSRVDTFVQSALDTSAVELGQAQTPSIDESVEIRVSQNGTQNLTASAIAREINRQLSGEFNELSRELQAVADEISSMDIGGITITADGKVLAEVTNDGEDKYRRNRQVTR